MKKLSLILTFILALTPGARSQEVFDLLRKGDVAAVKALIEKTPQLVEARDPQGMTPLHYAAYGRSPDLVNFLIDRGAKPEAKDAQAHTPLHVAAMNDGAEIAAALLERGGVLEARDDYGRTALVLCARERGQLATASVLIGAGADVNAVDKFGDGALSLAAWRGKAEFVDLLLNKGALVPEKGEKWKGLLQTAASQGLTSLFRRLTQAGQDLKAAAGEGLLRAAAEGGSAEIVGLLLGRGFDSGEPDRFGWLPLHYAARDGRVDAVRILIEKGAPLDARTVMGQTAYNVALERHMEAAAALLAEKGADKGGIRFPILEGDYLGQKPPADRPELFAPGIVSSIWGLHSAAVFSPDGNEVYWAPMMTFPGEVYSRGGLLMMTRIGGRWTPPAWAPFSGPNGDDDVPFFSPDGKRLYFISRRPLPGEERRGNERIWYVDRTADGWSGPKPLDSNVNSTDMHWAFSLDRDKTIYFAGRSPDSLGMSDIYMARFKDGSYERPVNLGEPVNSGGIEDSPFVAADGSYLLFSRQFDIWLSFRKADGAWSDPLKLGPEINSPSIEVCPRVTDDGKFIFFLSQRGGESHVYWVSAKVLDELKAKTLGGPGERWIQENDETKFQTKESAR
jgi:ankyrin repeat protein